MKRILFISQYLNRAGTEAFMMNVCRGIDHRKFQVDFLLYSQNETDYSREVEASGGKVWRVSSRRESPLRWYRDLNRFFKLHANEYAAIHYCGNGLTAIAPIVFAYLYKVPIRICHSHNSSSDGFHNKVLHLLQRGLARKLSTHHFACSTLAAKWFFGKAPAVIIKNGIDTERFAFDRRVRQEVRQTLGIEGDASVIGHVGRFEPEKNHVFILEVFAAYVKSHPTARLMLVGVGSLLAAVKEQAQKLGVDKNVMFMGERSDVPWLLQAMDAFLMPSLFEGQPFVLIEAQCAGLPCFISDTINKDICLTENVVTLPLSLPPAQWAERMSETMVAYQRKDECNAIKERGYSITSTIAYLESVYDQNEKQ